MHTRRSFLRCATGATLALPFLESLQAATAKPAQRLAIFYVPIGVVRRNFYPGEQEIGLVSFNDKEGQKLTAKNSRNVPLAFIRILSRPH